MDTILKVAGWLVVAGSVFVAVGLAGIAWRVFRRGRAKSKSDAPS